MKIFFQTILILNVSFIHFFENVKLPKGAIEIKNNSVKIGDLKQGKIATVNFELKNISKNTIQIYSVTSTCGCTIVEYPKQITANQKIIIKAKFNSTGFIGPVKKELVLITNDALKYYKMELSARVIK